jgi:hypothetical protein
MVFIAGCYQHQEVKMLKYFRSSIVVTLIGISLAYIIGGIQGAIIGSILAILEVSLSFDNAIVNAKVLQDMDSVWRHRFITWGMAIAVFGMRLVFPLLIVAVVAEISPFHALTLAIEAPDHYKALLTSAHTSIMGYGGAFLMLVFFKFFLDSAKDVHWIRMIEEPLTYLGKIEAVEIALTLLISVGVSHYLTVLHLAGDTFLISSIFGIITYVAADGIGSFLEEEEGEVIIRSGVASFLYLEVLDASFSFDGVIGAFALTNNLFIIAIGLGIGAMFVRSLTLMFVDKGTLNEFRYLEHGAFWAIGCLAGIMYVNTFHEIPDVITGFLGASFIGLALWTSIRYNKRNSEIESKFETYEEVHERFLEQRPTRYNPNNRTWEQLRNGKWEFLKDEFNSVRIPLPHVD